MYISVGVMAIGELLPRDFVEVKSQFFPATRIPATRIPVTRVPAWRARRAHVFQCSIPFHEIATAIVAAVAM